MAKRKGTKFLKDIGLSLFKTSEDKKIQYFNSTEFDDDYIEETFSDLVPNKAIGKIFKSTDAKYILLDFVFESDDGYDERIVSESFTKEGFERVKKTDLLDVMLLKLLSQISNKTTEPIEGYKLRYYTLRVYYR